MRIPGGVDFSDVAYGADFAETVRKTGMRKKNCGLRCGKGCVNNRNIVPGRSWRGNCTRISNPGTDPDVFYICLVQAIGIVKI